MVFNNNRKGQAAIEFLMTYGWMLLVVLIVGALIFSFVDFGNLLPNKVELNNGLIASVDGSYASAQGTGAGFALVTFTYNGAQQVILDVNNPNTKIVSDINSDECTLIFVKNVDSDTSHHNYTRSGVGAAANTPSPGAQIPAGVNTNPTVPFVSGQTGLLEFECLGINGGSGLYENDVLQGRLIVQVQNSKTQVPIPSSGSLRLSISE